MAKWMTLAAGIAALAGAVAAVFCVCSRKKKTVK